MEEVVERFCLDTIGAFTYANNRGSIAVLEKNNFRLIDVFEEKGIQSKYFELNKNE